MRLISTFLCSIMFTATSMGGSPTLPQAKDLVGEWVLSDSGRFCGIRFWIDDIPKANGFRLTIDAQAGGCNFPMDAVAWRPSSDGISLLDHEGGTLIFFSQEAGGYRSDIASDKGMQLRRKKAAE